MLLLLALPLNASAVPLVRDEPCVNPAALPWYPTAFISVGTNCTDLPVGATFHYERKQTPQETTYVFTLTLWAPGWGESIVLECADPDNWFPIHVGDTIVRPRPCYDPRFLA